MAWPGKDNDDYNDDGSITWKSEDWSTQEKINLKSTEKWQNINFGQWLAENVEIITNKYLVESYWVVPHITRTFAMSIPFDFPTLLKWKMYPRLAESDHFLPTWRSNFTGFRSIYRCEQKDTREDFKGSAKQICVIPLSWESWLRTYLFILGMTIRLPVMTNPISGMFAPSSSWGSCSEYKALMLTCS